MQLRHSKLEMTGWYMKDIPDRVRAAVEKMDTDLCRKMQEPQETDSASARFRLYLRLVGFCLYGCFSKPQAVVWWDRGAPALSENSARISDEVR